jgi:antitoxin CcdA
MSTLYDIAARKKPINLSINSDLLAKAKAYGINISNATEEHLADLVRRQMEKQWLAENRKTIEARNRFVEEHGVFSDRYRAF